MKFGPARPKPSSQEVESPSTQKVESSSTQHNPPPGGKPRHHKPWRQGIAFTVTALIIGAAYIASQNTGEEKPRIIGDPPPKPPVPTTEPIEISQLRSRAERGELSAHEELGDRYTKGKGVPQSHAEAAKWYLKPAMQGSGLAQFNLGFKYANGLGVPKNIEEAIRWYKKAAENKQARAQYNLGGIYEGGFGIPANKAEAKKW